MSEYILSKEYFVQVIRENSQEFQKRNNGGAEKSAPFLLARLKMFDLRNTV